MNIVKLLLSLGLILAVGSVSAQTYVSGYTKKNGTYVQPHVRSSPNATKTDNYGPARSSKASGASTYAPAYVSPYSRDKDNDGVSNQYDQDDDNDGANDDYDSTP